MQQVPSDIEIFDGLGDAVPYKAAVVGGGVIGLSWARLFAAHGTHVAVYDPREGVSAAVKHLDDEIGTGGGRVTSVDSMEQAVEGVAFVQESGPERLDSKIEIFERLGAAADDDAILMSSSSALLPSDFTQTLSTSDASRVLIGHPFNPPHVMPLVEVVPGDRTSRISVERAVQIYRAYGKHPVALTRETRGFVGNRLQNAVLREAVYLVQEGVIDPKGIDDIVKGSLGLRWAALGPFEGMHLGGGAEGFEGFMKHIGPSFAALEKATPDMSPEGIEGIVRQVSGAYGVPPDESIVERREKVQAAVLLARQKAVSSRGD